jgi:DNA-binding MarR family transcriptional regulator
MTWLLRYGACDFTTLKKQLGLTDGNLGAHLRVLEEANYIEIEKRFVGRKPNTVCRVTDAGREAFMAYLEQLEDVIRSVKSQQDLT